jgi:serine/threonine protein kinase
MIGIPGYEILEQIHQGKVTVVYRGKSKQKQQPVAIKLLKFQYPTLEEITRLRHKYKVIKDLNIGGVVKTYSLEKYQNAFALILEDFGGQSLSKILISRKLTISECLQIAIALASILIDLYQVEIIHKDIKPSNIIINVETGQIRNKIFGNILNFVKYLFLIYYSVLF